MVATKSQRFFITAQTLPAIENNMVAITIYQRSRVLTPDKGGILQEKFTQCQI
jgi:hypothetical protein